MNIRQTHAANVFNLTLVAQYFGIQLQTVVSAYEELSSDERFLREVNAKIDETRRHHAYTRGIFGRRHLSSVDWFAFERVLLYVLVRVMRPESVLETGVLYGGNSAFLLAALNKNGGGKLTSVDLPAIEAAKSGVVRHSAVRDSEEYPPRLRPGFIIPDYLRANWELIQGDSLAILPSLTKKYGLFVHDSEHSFGFVLNELSLAQRVLKRQGIMVVDDIDWSNGFFAFCVRQRLYPLLLTDNGKDNLRVRIGAVMMNHPRNGQAEACGER